MVHVSIMRGCVFSIFSLSLMWVSNIYGSGSGSGSGGGGSGSAPLHLLPLGTGAAPPHAMIPPVSPTLGPASPPCSFSFPLLPPSSANAWPFLAGSPPLLPVLNRGNTQAFQAELGQKDAQIIELQSSMAAVQSEIAFLSTRRDALENQIILLRQQNGTLVRENQLSISEIQRLQNENNTQATFLRNQLDLNTAYKTQVTSLTQQLSDMKAVREEELPYMQAVRAKKLDDAFSAGYLKALLSARELMPADTFNTLYLHLLTAVAAARASALPHDGAVIAGGGAVTASLGVFTAAAAAASSAMPPPPARAVGAMGASSVSGSGSASAVLQTASAKK